MGTSREVQAVEPLVALMEARTDDHDVPVLMSGVLEDGQLTLDALMAEGCISFEDNIFLVAHEVSSPTPLHRHEYIEIAYVLKGRVINRIGERELYLSKGTACIMGHDCEHMLDVDDPTSIICNVCLRDELLREPAYARFIKEDNLFGRFMRGQTGGTYLVLTDVDNRAIQMAMAALINAYAANGYRSGFDVEARTMLLLYALSTAKTYSSHGPNERVTQMLDYIKEHSAEVSVRSLAQEFGYNENYLTQYIRKTTGKRASQFIIDARIEHACELLRSGDLPVEQVAHEVGYKSYSRFHQVFKERMGMTPNDWREGGA